MIHRLLSFFTPRSLRARLFLLVLAMVMLAEAVTFSLVSEYRHRFFDEVAMRYIVTTIRTLRASLSEIPVEDRDAFVRIASQGQWHLWARELPPEATLQRRWDGPWRRDGMQGGPPPDGFHPDGFHPGCCHPDDFHPDGFHPDGFHPPGPPPNGQGDNGPPGPPLHDDGHGDPRGDMHGDLHDGGGFHPPERPKRLLSQPEPNKDLAHLVRVLNERLNDGTRVALSHGPNPRLFISLANDPIAEDVPDLREWLVIPIEGLEPPSLTPLLLVVLAGVGLVLLLSAGFSWHISRPLTRLANAADRLAAGKPSRVEPSGPSETRLLGERFNAMLDGLEESESVRRTLLAGLPHDLKTPLSRMWLRIELAEDSSLKEGLRTDLMDMQHMVDQFIGFLRGSDPQAYRYADVGLTEWLSERVHAWQSAGSDVTLTIAPRAADVHVMGDPVALGRLLDNLIGNALHHGQPPVEVGLDLIDDKVRLTVDDHGQGIPPERRQEAMRPFARLDGARTRTGNVGLGLALADSIARTHRGTLVLEAAPSGGLRVRVDLPPLDATGNTNAT